MRYNGKDPTMIHPAVRVGKEYHAEKSREIAVMETSRRARVAYAKTEGCEIRTLLNVAGRNARDGMDALLAIRAWAEGSGGESELEPTAAPGKCYDAVLQSIEEPELTRGFGTVEVIHYAADARMRSKAQRKARATNAHALRFFVGGTTKTSFDVSITPTETQGDGLLLRMDGTVFYGHTQSVGAGQELSIELAKNAVTLSGVTAAAGADWLVTDYDVEIGPGWHELTSSAAGTLQVRWYDRWA